MKKKQKKKPGIFHVRNIFPLVADMILVLLLTLPTFRFIHNSSVQSKQSIFSLMKNAWMGSREYLFSSSMETTQAGTAMYKTIFTLLIIFSILFMLGVIINIFSIRVTYKSLSGSKENENAKNLFLAIIPNRALLCIFRLTVIPIFFLPRVVASLYRDLLFQSVTIRFVFIDPTIIALALFVATVALVLVAKKTEAREKIDLFAKSPKAEEFESEDPSDTPDERVYQITEGEDTAQRIRKMFDDSEK
ncbi:MAG: hypothetical protein J6S10_04290 [Clostridia bacterium]|nr:hypothetical protein [Clostridia bacterium]